MVKGSKSEYVSEYDMVRSGNPNISKICSSSNPNMYPNMYTIMAARQQ